MSTVPATAVDQILLETVRWFHQHFIVYHFVYHFAFVSKGPLICTFQHNHPSFMWKRYFFTFSHLQFTSIQIRDPDVCQTQLAMYWLCQENKFIWNNSKSTQNPCYVFAIKEYGSIKSLSCGLGILPLDSLRRACPEVMAKTFADWVCHSPEIWEFRGWQSLELDISQWVGGRGGGNTWLDRAVCRTFQALSRFYTVWRPFCVAKWWG